MLFILVGFMLSCNSSVNNKSEPVDFFELSIEEAQTLMESGLLTSQQLVEYYLQRISKIDKDGPQLNAVITLNPDALKIAKQLDTDGANGKVRGPLHGIPVLIKDNIDTHDKMPNTAGSLLLNNNFPDKDAFIVNQLRESGAVLLGKTNLSEWANFRSTKSSSGWSSKGGQTTNPYNTEMSPCGSSAGSGVAVAADLCMVAIGTETDGSIACPSAINGVVGIKPTVGLWSRSGIIPISHSQDTPGPMARSVKDAAIFLGACTGKDYRDPSTAGQQVSADYAVFCQKGFLSGKRLGVDTSFLNVDSPAGKIFMETVEDLKSLGAEIIEVDYRSKMDGVGDAEFEILLYEIKHDMEVYLSDKNLPYKTLEDIVNANQEGKDSLMPIFGQELFEMAIKKGNLEDEVYQQAIVNCTQRTRTVLDSVTSSLKLDAIVGPTLGPSWKIDHENGDNFNGPASYSAGARSGYPHITVPMGMVDGLPLGLTIMAGPYEEGKIISYAYDYEQYFNKRVSPTFN
jgi:amidase